MKFGIIGLGRMGGGLALQAMEKGHQVVGYNRSPERTHTLVRQGLEPAFSLAELGRKLEAPGPLWLYVPHGKPTDQTIAELEGHLQQGDLIAEGGNSHWQDSVRHYEALRAQGIAFLDVDTSGDLEGARHGACFMVGGEAHGSRDQASHSR